MKYLCIGFLILVSFSWHHPDENKNNPHPAGDTARNIFIITLDGFRWQELFKGADSDIMLNPSFTADSETVSSMFGAGTAGERRKKLMPFIWNVAATKGQIFGNREYGNDVNVANLYDISYAGYNEIFTGTTDLTIFSNDKVNNSNRNVFEYHNNKETYARKIALFTSWDVFPYILNKKRSGIQMNCGYENVKEENTTQNILNTVQTEVGANKAHTTRDMLTFIAAKEYLEQHHPKLLYLGLGETDEYAHHGNYDMYLQRANEADHIISELWHWAQTTEGYKNNTTFIITTDHGRGKNAAEWTSHGTFIKGSAQAWLILLGKGVAPGGEIKATGKIYQNQLAQTIARLAGEDFGSRVPVDFTAN